MTAYVLLMGAAVWHALALGTIGKRGTIVHTLTGVGLVVGFATGPAGYAGIGAALATVVLGRWLATEHGRAVAGELAGVVVRSAVRWTVDTFWSCLVAVARVFSPAPTYEAAPVERPEPVLTPGETAHATPQMMRWTPEARPAVERGGTAEDTDPVSPVTRVETYMDILGQVAAGVTGFNEGARLCEARFEVSRSKYARDLRDLREQRAA